MRALPTLALTLGGILLLAGCLDALTPPGQPGAPGAAPRSEPFRTLEQGGYSHIRAAESVVVTNESAYLALWARHTGNSSAAPPPVNFTVDRVVAIFAGDQPDSCRQAKVINASTDEAAKVTTVRWNLTSPSSPSTACDSVITHPYVLVALRQRDTTIQVVGPSAGGDDASPAEGRALNAAFKEYTEKRYAVFRDARSWERALQPGTSVPPVDFTQEMVVAVFMGPAPNGCYGVELGAITPRATHTEVEVRYRGPAADAYCTEVFGWPTLAYAVPKAENVSFRETYTDLAPSAPRTPEKVGSATFLRADEAPGINDRRVVIVDDQQEWVALWAQAHPSGGSAPPTVDFARHRVVASFLGADVPTCVSATGVGHVHEPAQGEIVLDMLVWMAGPNVNCVRHASHVASYYTIPVTGTVTTRDVYVNTAPA